MDVELKEYQKELQIIKVKISLIKKQLSEIDRYFKLLSFMGGIGGLFAYLIAREKGLNFLLSILLYISTALLFAFIFIMCFAKFTKKGKKYWKLFKELKILDKRMTHLLHVLKDWHNDMLLEKRGVFCWGCQKEINEEESRESLKFCSICRKFPHNQK